MEAPQFAREPPIRDKVMSENPAQTAIIRQCSGKRIACQYFVNREAAASNRRSDICRVPTHCAACPKNALSNASLQACIAN
jgi:hypothetical protein